jgi:hypothetical protein
MPFDIRPLGPKEDLVRVIWSIQTREKGHTTSTYKNRIQPSRLTSREAVGVMLPSQIGQLSGTEGNYARFSGDVVKAVSAIMLKTKAKLEYVDGLVADCLERPLKTFHPYEEYDEDAWESRPPDEEKETEPVPTPPEVERTEFEHLQRCLALQKQIYDSVSKERTLEQKQAVSNYLALQLEL